MANLSNIDNKFLVTTGGNIGIGDTGPTRSLSILRSEAVVNIKSSGVSGHSMIILDHASSANNYSQVRFSNAGLAKFAIGIDPQDSYKLKIVNDGNATGANTRMTITTGGNVGIGTDSPVTKLELKGLIAGSVTNDRETTTSSFVINGITENMSLQFGLGGSALNYGNWIQSGYDNGVPTASSLLLNPIGGNVGIGTISPGTLHGASYGTTKLHIDGANDRGQMIIEGDSLASIILSDNGYTANQRVFSIGNNGGLFNIKPLNDNGTSSASNGFNMLHNGNVGIGTVSPDIGSNAGTAILTLKNTGTNRAVLNMTSTTPGTGVYAQEAFYNGGVLKTLVQHVGDGSTDSGYIKWFTTASGGATTERMRIDSSGNLTLKSASVVTLKAAPLGSTYGGGFNAITVTGTSSAPYTSTLGFSNYGVANAMVIEGANVGIGNTVPRDKLTVFTAGAAEEEIGLRLVNPVGFTNTGSGASIIFAQDRNTGENYPMAKIRSTQGIAGTSGYGNLAFSTSSAGTMSDQMTILSSGDVGIGVTSPTAKLDINGTVRYRGNTYNQLAYQVTGNYSANTWYTIATTATLTEQGIYILVAYVEDFTAGGGNYYIHACSTNFYWVTTGTNRPTAFNFPALLGTGHATASLPLIRITQELGSAGAQSKIQWQTPYTYTGLAPTSAGKKLFFYFKRIGG